MACCLEDNRVPLGGGIEGVVVVEEGRWIGVVEDAIQELGRKSELRTAVLH